MRNSIDFVILTFDDNKLKVLLIKRDEEPFKEEWAIPGFITPENEDVTIAVRNRLLSSFNNKIPHHKQIETFGSANRHPEGHVITICHYLLMNKENFTISLKETKKWVDVDILPPLAFDHEKLISTCVNKLKKNIKIAPVAFHLLPKYFRLSEVVDLYIEILDKKIDKRNFIRKLKYFNIVDSSGLSESGVKHRPAELYNYDINLYKNLIERGKDFRLP